MNLQDFIPQTEPERSFFYALVQVWQEQGSPARRDCFFTFSDLLKRVELPDTPKNRERLHVWLTRNSDNTTTVRLTDDPSTSTP